MTVILLLLVGVTGCAHRFPVDGSGRAVKADEALVHQLTSDIQSLDRSVNPHEAREVADVAMNTAHQLANDYKVVRPAFVHNILVNTKFRSRGLCFHWADDLQDPLRQISLNSLHLYRVVSGMNTSHEHNALVITPKEFPMRRGLLLDAWRHGGSLYWVRVRQDLKYNWILRQDLPWIGIQVEPKSSIDPAAVGH